MNRLSIDRQGKLVGNYAPGIDYNSPWPAVNGNEHATFPPYKGTILHTMVCNLDVAIRLFNDPKRRASAHLGVSQRGHIHQFGPLDGWEAWHVMAGNGDWFGVEFADNGDPNNAYTEAQKHAAALIVDAIHRKYRIPVKVSDSTSTPGIGTHNMGLAAWGAHSCPDATVNPNHVRSRARQEIVDLVMELRKPVPRGPVPKAPAPKSPEEEVMVVLELDPDKGNVALPVPAGKRTVTFAADPGAVIEYGFQPWTGRKTLDVTWMGGPEKVAVPPGAKLITIRRYASSDNRHLVTVYFS